jgi:hypothetical protein
MPLRTLIALGLAGTFLAAPAWAQHTTKSSPHGAAVSTEPSVTGVVIDTRGLNYEPRMSPRLFDDGAHNLLEGCSFDPDRVTNDGFARWVRAFNSDEDNPRVGKHPLVIKPVRLEAGDRLVFDATDSAKLRFANAKSKVIDRMRILIVY